MSERISTGRKERIEHIQYGAFQEHGTWYLSVDGIESIPVDSILGENIAIALAVQNKVDAAIIGQHRPGFLRTIRMMNCRKTAFAVTGKHLVKKFVEGRTKLKVSPDRATIREMSGTDELLDDVERILVDGNIPVLGTKDDMHIVSYLETHPVMPVILHVFNTDERNLSAVVSNLFSRKKPAHLKNFFGKLHRDHTFLVLGKTSSGRYVCFHKRGPTENHPFELAYLESAIDTAIEPQDGRIYVTVIGNALDRNSEEKKAFPRSA